MISLKELAISSEIHDGGTENNTGISRLSLLGCCMTTMANMAWLLYEKLFIDFN